jgi:transcriptional regulator with XRE-family HTH domain
MDAGELIAEARAVAGLTQAGLARRAGTSQAMVARYEAGRASPTVAALQRLLRAAGHDLLLSSRPSADGVAPGYSSVARSPVAVLRRHRVEIRAAAARLRIGNVRITGPAVRGRTSLAGRADLLVNLRTGKRGLLPLLALAAEVEQITGGRFDVLTSDIMTEPAGARAATEAMPL